MQIRDRYKLNKDAKNGTELQCPSCNNKFVKNNYQQAFCKTKSGTVCKDKYWNTVDERKRNNTTRISPASALYLDRQALKRGFPDHKTRKNHVDDYDGSWDAHTCNVEPCDYCGLRHEYCECDY